MFYSCSKNRLQVTPTRCRLEIVAAIKVMDVTQATPRARAHRSFVSQYFSLMRTASSRLLLEESFICPHFVPSKNVMWGRMYVYRVFI